jgi:galactokinase
VRSERRAKLERVSRRVTAEEEAPRQALRVPPPRHSHCPGRVNLIGDHTDYNGGVALPMAIDLGTDVVFEPDSSELLVLKSDTEDEHAEVHVKIPLEHEYLRSVRPPWARYVAGMVAVVRPRTGGWGRITTTLPVGAGLSSSSALCVSVALALGLEGSPPRLARICQRGEQEATGMQGGIMDQLVTTSAVEGAALLIDFADLSGRPVPVPEEAEFVVVHSGQSRNLPMTAYAARRAECEAASFHLGPLGRVDPEAILGIPDPTLRRRARHVVTECDRVRWFARALVAGDLEEAGRLMTASHQSLATDFEVSTPALDQLVGTLIQVPGVHGARLTGAGFGGCVVALTRPGTLDLGDYPDGAWRVRASRAASVEEL